MNNCIEREAIPPGMWEISDFNVRITVSSFLCPSQQGLFGGYILLSNNNIRDLKKRTMTY